MICIKHSDDWFDVAINYNTLAINKMIDGMWLKKKNSQEIFERCLVNLEMNY